jgi:photosynthetic reaction center H subunit
MRGSLTSYIDVAQMTLYAFFIFFAGIVYYLRREDKREGYPLEADNMPRGITVKEGFPLVPRAKTFRLMHGGTYQAPPGKTEERPILARQVDPWPGSPLQPTGDPMIDGVGPASYALRRDEPERRIDGSPMIVPLRIARDNVVDIEDSDPRGMTVLGADEQVAGTVGDIWTDRAEPQIRYLEVTLAGPEARSVLLPITFARISGRRREVRVKSILARHFATVPGLQNPDQVTKREEDRIMAYYGSGHLYAKPSRLGPLL